MICTNWENGVTDCYELFNASLIVFVITNKCTIIYHKNISLYNIYSYMFRHFNAIVREFYF